MPEILSQGERWCWETRNPIPPSGSAGGAGLLERFSEDSAGTFGCAVILESPEVEHVAQVITNDVGASAVDDGSDGLHAGGAAQKDAQA